MNELLQLLLSSINDEWEAATTYGIQATMLRGLYRDPVAEHLDEHAEDERGHAQRLTLHLYARGVDIDVKLSELTIGVTIEDMLRIDLKLEIEAIDKYTKIIQLCEDNPELTDTKVLIEDILTDEIEHMDDYAALLRTKVKDKEAPIKSAETIGLMKKVADRMDLFGRTDIADKYDECISLAIERQAHG